MRKLMSSGLFLLVCLVPAVKAQTNVVPAGTLLRCVMDEPNFSAKTAEVGDPVLCHLSGVTEFGHSVFPRGAYLGGRFEEDKEPGHLVGKGYMEIVFDHIGMPNTDEQLETKIVAAQGQKVDRQGDILGKGHAKRDVAEWMLPPLWPWKVVMLPARGPEPKLKAEEVLTLRLMEDIEVPQSTAYSAPAPASGWHSFGQSDPGASPQRQFYVPPDPVSPSARVVKQNISFKTSPSNAPAGQIAVLALRSQVVYSMTDYWIADGQIHFVLPDGRQESADVNNVDWPRTGDLNAERWIRLTLQSRANSYFPPNHESDILVGYSRPISNPSVSR
jgi:hypothetical protein